MALSELRKQELLKEVENFCNKLELYRGMVVNGLNKGEMTKPQWQKFYNFRIELLQLYGQLKEVIEECATSTVTFRNAEHDVFLLALSHEKIQKFTFEALQLAIARVNIVVGKLRAKSLPKTLLDSTEMISPKAFVAHGGKTKALEKLCSFLEALRIKPILAEIEPTEGKRVSGLRGMWMNVWLMQIVQLY